MHIFIPSINNLYLKTILLGKCYFGAGSETVDYRDISLQLSTTFPYMYDIGMIFLYKNIA